MYEFNKKSFHLLFKNLLKIIHEARLKIPNAGSTWLIVKIRIYVTKWLYWWILIHLQIDVAKHLPVLGLEAVVTTVNAVFLDTVVSALALEAKNYQIIFNKSKILRLLNRSILFVYVYNFTRLSLAMG